MRRPNASRCCPLLGALLICAIPALGQKSYEITPLVGGLFGGTMKLGEEDSSNFKAHLPDRLSFGIAGGVRFGDDDCEDCDVIEFRWLRQNTHLRLDQDFFLPAPTGAPFFNPAVTVDDYLGDFTHEWKLKETRKVRPFLTASLGAAHMTTPAGGGTRFAFAFSTGAKVFPKPHWGIRFEVEYLPIVMDAELERVVCAGGCIVALSGGLMNQFQVSVGPIFRFSVR